MYSIKLPRKKNSTDNKKAILGISLKKEYSFYKNKDDLFKMVKEVDKMQLAVCYIVIADGELYLNSLLSNHPKGDVDIMRKQSYQAGKDWKRKFDIDNAIKNSKTKMVILHWENVVKNSKEFKNNENMIMVNNLMESDKDISFKKSVNKMALSFIDRNSNSKNQLDSEKIGHSKKYICLELAGLFNFAKNNDIDFFIYPGKEFQPLSFLRRNYFNGQVLNWCSLQKSTLSKHISIFQNSTSIIQVKKTLDNIKDNELIRAKDIKCIVDIMQESQIKEYNKMNRKVDNLTRIGYGILFLFILSVGLLMVGNKFSESDSSSDDDHDFNFSPSFGLRP